MDESFQKFEVCFKTPETSHWCRTVESQQSRIPIDFVLISWYKNTIFVLILFFTWFVLVTKWNIKVYDFNKIKNVFCENCKKNLSIHFHITIRWFWQGFVYENDFIFLLIMLWMFVPLTRVYFEVSKISLLEYIIICN